MAIKDAVDTKQPQPSRLFVFILNNARPDKEIADILNASFVRYAFGVRFMEETSLIMELEAHTGTAGFLFFAYFFSAESLNEGYDIVPWDVGFDRLVEDSVKSASLLGIKRTPWFRHLKALYIFASSQVLFACSSR